MKKAPTKETVDNNEPSRGMGRMRSVDFRDALFSMPQRIVLIQGKKQWNEPPVMDQGNTSRCVAFAGIGYFAAGPVTNKQINLPFTVDQLYAECQRNDEWSGEDHDGTSVRALFKVAKNAGLVSEYRWGRTSVDISNWILKNGPVVLGTDWNAAMFDPEKYDAPGPEGAGLWCRVRPEQNPQIVGGHSYLAIGTDTRKVCPDGTFGAVRIQNSWGRDWGTNGRVWMSLRELDILMAAGGEAATATEIKLAA